ncbi:MAG: nucleotidyl transferase AbiEii/AbiGii toxin family protein [Planctomycetes bacterium]|nr:nucleotidyl transferase AbiEii/AbiGii toxin family protein [Planctomycetota bacterium]
MDAFLRQPVDARLRLFKETEERLGIPARIVEKDFWVCWTLRQLFSLPEFGPHLTFKGGTSLSKVWGWVERFSEDIDVVLDRVWLGFGGKQSPEAAPSAKQRNARLGALKTACRERIDSGLGPALETAVRSALPADARWALRRDEDDPDGQTILFDYPGCWVGPADAYVLPMVKIEMGARSDDWPAEKATVKSYAAETFPQAFADAACPVRVLAAERTFWEKATLLHEETYRPANKPRKARMSRHYYDLWCLIRKGVADRAIAIRGLLDRVVEHRKAFFPRSWVDYATMRRGTLRLVPRAGQLAEWRSDYEAMRAEMFMGTPPPFDEVLAEVHRFEENFNRA